MNRFGTHSDLAIVVGGFVNGLGLVRSLAALGCRVIVITTNPFDIAQYSRYVLEHHPLGDIDQYPERLATVLEQHARDWAGALVLPTNDAAIASLNSNRDVLSAWYRLALPSPDCVPYLLERTRMMQAAADVGMLLPKSYGPATESVLQHPELGYPLVVKPARSGEFSARLGKKLFVARDASALKACIDRVAEARIDGQVFDFIPGPDHEIFVYCVYVDLHGQAIAQCTIHKLRQSPPMFGVARVAEFASNIPLLREQSLELLRHIGLRGFAAVEFKRDPRDGSFRFLEVNGRSVIYNSLLRRGNFDIAELLWSDYGSGQLKRVETAWWPGVWIHLHADLLRSVQNWRKEGLTMRDYLEPYKREKTFAVWSSSDPRPFMAQWSRSARAAGLAVFRRKRPG